MEERPFMDRTAEPDEQAVQDALGGTWPFYQALMVSAPPASRATGDSARAEGGC
jgi:hypothetical protein